VGASGCVITNTLTSDTLAFDSVLQNEACNGPGQCTFRNILVDPGTVGFASGALNHSPQNGDFRVAQIAFCAVAQGDTTLHWQFSPPDPATRDSDIIDRFNQPVGNRTLDRKSDV